MRVALACLIALAVRAALPSEARACDSSPPHSESRSHLLGVDRDGNFVQYHQSWSESTDGTTHGFVAYDKDGEVIAILDLEGGEPTGDYFSAVLRAQVSDPKIIAADLIASKHLEQPVPRKIRHVASKAKCGSLEIESKSGWLRVADVGALSHHRPETCSALGVQAFDHPKANVTFVRARFSIVSGSSEDWSVEHDRVHMLPKARIEAAELTLLAERAHFGHDLDKATTMVERAIRIAPEYLPARSTLIRTYAKDGRSWESLLELLDADVPDGRTFIGTGPSKQLLKALPTMWKEAATHEAGWTWDTIAPRTLDESFL
jgi:hypothetical protein